MKRLFDERLGRYQAAIALEPIDRMPIAPGSNSFAETYSGHTFQQIVYEGEAWNEAVRDFLRDFPQVDVVRPLRIWGPIYDVMDSKLYRMTGRDLPPDVQYQYVEQEYMKGDEYDVFIENPLKFIVERFFPRVFGEMAESGSWRSNMAFLKGGIAYVLRREHNRKKVEFAEKVLGAPLAMSGSALAPFDFLSDVFRGLRGITTDLYRQPEKVLAACDVVVPLIVSSAIRGADALRRYPIHMPFHKAPVLSAGQFETFYWPSLKRVMLLLIEAGFTIRAYMEGSWSRHWHHMLELPKGRVLCDVDSQDDIFRAKADIGHHVCLAGGLPDSLLILGTPEEVRQRVRTLCEKAAADGGLIVNGGCNIPRNTKPENFRAMVDAVLEFGRHGETWKPRPKEGHAPLDATRLPELPLLVPWEAKLAEWGGSVQGDANMIRESWEQLEKMAVDFIMLWTV